MRNFRNLLSVSAKDLAVTLKPACFFIVFYRVNRWMLGKPAYNIFDGKYYRVHFGVVQITHFNHVYILGNGELLDLLRNGVKNGKIE